MAEDQQKAKQTEAVEEEETSKEEAKAAEANGKLSDNGSKDKEGAETPADEEAEAPVSEDESETATSEIQAEATPDEEIDPPSEADPIAKADPSAEAEASAKAEASTKAEASAKAEPSADADASAKAEPSADADASVEADATDVADVDPDEIAASNDADDDSDGGPKGRLLEEAVDAATSAMDVPAAEDAGVSATEDEPLTSISAADPLEPTGRVGYTGEIVGRVIKLEDLEGDGEEVTAASQSYEQLMKLVEQSFTKVKEQEIVHGRVVSVGEKDVVIDIGFKSDGVVSLNEFDRELKAGDEVEVFIDRLEDYHGQLVLSKTKADQVRRWQRIEDAFNNEQVLEGTIVRRIKGGMIVELFGNMEAFLPGSQIDVRPVRDFDAYLGTKMEFKIVKLNPANENIVVSHKALIEKELEAQRKNILSTMESGQILEGIVKNITDFGVFIDLGGVDGLLHITDLSWGRVSHPSELVDLDEKLNVVVLDYDKERQRISLGLKQLQPHPWEDINEKYTEGETVEGKVVSITDYGAFVELEKGIEGLVHISEMSWTEHIRHPSQMVSLGQLVKVKILNIDKEGKKISLGMKQLEPDPWTGIAERYPPGTVLRGKVRNITNFGVFVEIEPGIDGLVHISDLSWTKKIRHPGEMIKKGQDLDVVILNVDEEARRISLGHKQVETNPWNQFAKVYAEGTDTTAKVVRSNEGGLVVELPLEVEAFVPASELKNGPQNFQEFYQTDQEIELRVIKFDPNQKEIVLSEAAKDRAEERVERQEQERERRTERKREDREVREFKKGAEASGPTTLGELSGLADLKAQIEEAESAAVIGGKDDAEAMAREAALPGPAEKESIPEAEDDDATIVDEGPTPEQQAEAEMEESDETVVTTAEASGEMEATPGAKQRGQAGKRKEQAGDKRTKASHPTEPPASRDQRQEDAGDVMPAEKSKASAKSVGDTDKEGAAEAAEAATQDKTPAKEGGDKPIATIEGEPSVAEIESRTTTEEGEKAVTKEKVKQKAEEAADAAEEAAEPEEAAEAEESETEAEAAAGKTVAEADVEAETEESVAEAEAEEADADEAVAETGVEDAEAEEPAEQEKKEEK